MLCLGHQTAPDRAVDSKRLEVFEQNGETEREHEEMGVSQSLGEHRNAVKQDENIPSMTLTVSNRNNAKAEEDFNQQQSAEEVFVLFQLQNENGPTKLLPAPGDKDPACPCHRMSWRNQGCSLCLTFQPALFTPCQLISSHSTVELNKELLFFIRK